MAQNEDMAANLKKFQDIIEKSADVGIALQDELVTIILMSILRLSFENFNVAMETRDKLPTFHESKLKLLDEIERRENVIF